MVLEKFTDCITAVLRVSFDIRQVGTHFLRRLPKMFNVSLFPKP